MQEPQPSIALPDQPRVLIFGDSWTVGAAASPEHGYAYAIAEIAGWETIVDGVSGSGYLRAGLLGPPFPARADALDAELAPALVILQGSINDLQQDLATYDEAVRETWATVASRFPEAEVVVFGPAPHILPLMPEIIELDARLTSLAAERGWPYISPVRDEWITDDNFDEVIDTSPAGAYHPSDNGHRYLAERLAAAVGELTDASAD